MWTEQEYPLQSRFISDWEAAPGKMGRHKISYSILFEIMKMF